MHYMHVSFPDLPSMVLQFLDPSSDRNLSSSSPSAYISSDRSFPSVPVWALKQGLASQQAGLTGAPQLTSPIGHMCQTCGMTFPSKEKLEVHEVSHGPPTQVVSPYLSMAVPM